MNEPPIITNPPAHMGRPRLLLSLGFATTVLVASGLLLWRYLAGRSETWPATLTAINGAKMIKADDILPHVTPGPGGIPSTLRWRELSWGKQDGEHDPSAAPGQPGCYGLAWHVKGYNNTVIVFQDKRELQFGSGGWYSQIRVPDDIQISAEDIGRIQAEWLRKTYGGSWAVQVLR